MKTALPKLLFYYSALASLFIAISTILTSQTGAPVIFATLFLPVVAYFVVELFKNLRSTFGHQKLNVKPSFSEISFSESVVLSIIFLLLLGIGIKNILNTPKLDNVNPPIQSSQLIIPKSKDTDPVTKNMLTIEITDGSESVNIRSKPTIYSEKIGTATNNQELEYTKKDGEWYEVIIDGNQIGYISFKYVKGDPRR